MRPLTHAPLPDWSDVVAGVLGQSPSDAALARPWLQGDGTPFWFSRSAWSLYAIAELRKRVTAKASVRVWLPGYFCNESLEPLRASGAEIIFYPILLNGSADAATCAQLAAIASPDLVVAVHYFGQPADLAALTQLSRETGAWLIEDAAHVLRPVPGVGERGDFVLYSPHKLVPIPDGALLVVRHDGPGIVTRDLLGAHDFAGLYESIVVERRAAWRVVYGWLAKRLLQKLGVGTARSSGPPFHDDAVPGKSRAFPAPQMSTLAKRLLRRIAGRLDEESAAREEHSALWLSRLTSRDGADVATPMAMPATPYLAGISLATSDHAEHLYARLQGASIPVVTWPDLPPEVQADPRRHRAAIALRATRVFLPVHRSMSPTSIQAALARPVR